jgi:pilus assembly protein Flp/PilA
MNLKNILISFIRDEQGQDLIEYALLAGLISLGSWAAMVALGGAITTKYNNLSDSVIAAGS